MKDYFNKFKKYAFRLELLQSYSVEQEKKDFMKFLKDGKVSKDENKEWYETIKNAKSRGAIIQRVHVISFPLSDYIKFEMEAYRYNMKEGEQIFTIPYRKFLKLMPKIKKDFWLFDDKIVKINDYIELKDILLSKAKIFI